MDPVSQGVVGAAFAQIAARRTTLATVAWYGALGGMAPDLDVLFQSSADPLFFLEFHRQFTHSLIFIPVGAFLVFLALRAVANRIKILQGLSTGQAYLACLMGYATHGLLDSCTSYGTQLFWPFSDARLPGIPCPSSTHCSPFRCWYSLLQQREPSANGCRSCLRLDAGLLRPRLAATRAR